MEKSLGQIKNMRFDIDKPMALKFDIEYNKLTLFTGLNGTGKSLIMKLNWVFGTVMSLLIHHPPSANETAQYIMDKTFEDQNFNGEMEAFYPNGSLKMFMENGKVMRVEYFIDPCVKVITPSLYMSTNTRTFTQINQYLKVEKHLPTKEEISNIYRLYDIVYIETLKMKLENGLKATQAFKDSMSNDFSMKYDFDTFALENEAVIFIDKDGNKRDLSTLSAGEQSLINMSLASM
jgi:hypothetical protein